MTVYESATAAIDRWVLEQKYSIHAFTKAMLMRDYLLAMPVELAELEIEEE